MATTHQMLSGSTDEEFTGRLASSHRDRFGEPFWSFFAKEVEPRLPEAFTTVDLGCGPGLFLHDLATRHPQAMLYGYDVTLSMIAYAQSLRWPIQPPTLAIHDVSSQPLPLVENCVHLLSMMSVLHLFDDPLSVLAEIRRVLAPGGVFFLRDWIRSPLKDYLERRRGDGGEETIASRQAGFRLFAVHNKYTVEDWEWLLAEAGFRIRCQTTLRPTHRIFVTTAG